jgi:hypothetical protein
MQTIHLTRVGDLRMSRLCWFALICSTIIGTNSCGKPSTIPITGTTSWDNWPRFCDVETSGSPVSVIAPDEQKDAGPYRHERAGGPR